MNQILKLLIFILQAYLVTGTLIAQDKKVIISEKVGDEIDTREREIYNLFTGFENFKSAAYYRTGDGKYYLKVKLESPGENAKDSIIYLDEKNVFNTALRVVFHEDIIKGAFPKGQKFSLDTLENKYEVRISNEHREVFPFEKPKRKQTDKYPSVGLGISFSHLSVDLGQVRSFFEKVENSFREQGWDVPRNNLNFNPSQVYTFNFYIRLYKTFGIEVEIGRSLNSDADFYYSAAFLHYHFSFNNPRWFKPFVAAGIGKHSFYIEKYYGATINTNGAYLEKIISGGEQYGYFLKGGFEVGIPTEGHFLPFCLNVFGSYSYIPEISAYNSYETYGYHTAVKLGGVRFGAGLRVYL